MAKIFNKIFKIKIIFLDSYIIQLHSKLGHNCRSHFIKNVHIINESNFIFSYFTSITSWQKF